MAFRKPLVLDGIGATQQLQANDEADIPLEYRVQELQNQLDLLCGFLIAQGFDLPDELFKEYQF